MSAKHAPGPWYGTPNDEFWSATHDGIGSSAYQVVRDASGTVVALVVAQQPDPFSEAPPTEHNARLIAAAPDLLDALRNLLNRSENEGWAYSAEEREEARAAIARATGEQP